MNYTHIDIRDTALAAWREGERVIAVMQLDAPKEQLGGRYLTEVFGVALMRVTGDWIPVESDTRLRRAAP
jgi:hypothetical protein